MFQFSLFFFLCIQLDIGVWPNRHSLTWSTSIISHLSLQQTDDLCLEESISQVMIEDELEERDISGNSGSHITREDAYSDQVSCHNLPSLTAYFIINSENAEEDRAFLQV
jgi:hypothetical protein